MKKVIVSRLFNVLSDYEDAIPTSTMLVIDKVRHDKNLFIVMENCSCDDVLFYDYSYPFIDYIIACNGSYVYNPRKKKVIFKKKMLSTDLNRIEKNITSKTKYYTEEDGVYKIDIIDYKKSDLELIKKLKLNYFINNNILEVNRCDKLEALNKILKDKYNNKDIISIGYDESDKCVLDNTCGYLVKYGENNNKVVEKILKENF